MIKTFLMTSGVAVLSKEQSKLILAGSEYATCDSDGANQGAQCGPHHYCECGGCQDVTTESEPCE